jgi:hypothetical protein
VKGRHITVDLLIKIGCLVEKKSIVLTRESSLSELVSTMRSTVLILPLQLGFPGGSSELVFFKVNASGFDDTS